MFTGHENESLLKWKTEKRLSVPIGQAQVNAFIADRHPLPSSRSFTHRLTRLRALIIQMLFFKYYFGSFFFLGLYYFGDRQKTLMESGEDDIQLRHFPYQNQNRNAALMWYMS